MNQESIDYSSCLLVILVKFLLQLLTALIVIMPSTAVDPAFLDCGQAPGIEIWRIEVIYLLDVQTGDFLLNNATPVTFLHKRFYGISTSWFLLTIPAIGMHCTLSTVQLTIRVNHFLTLTKFHRLDLTQFLTFSDRISKSFVKIQKPMANFILVIHTLS